MGGRRHNRFLDFAGAGSFGGKQTEGSSLGNFCFIRAFEIFGVDNLAERDHQWSNRRPDTVHRPDTDDGQ